MLERIISKDDLKVQIVSMILKSQSLPNRSPTSRQVNSLRKKELRQENRKYEVYSKNNR